MNNEMENCAQLVLHLFAHCRHASDVQDLASDRFPHASLLRQVWDCDLELCEKSKHIFTAKTMQH